MDESNNLHFSSPPLSLLDSFTSAQGTVPPIPRPRRGSSSSSSSFSSSTPKQVINFHGSLTTRPGHCSSSIPNARNSNKNGKITWTSATESSGNCDVKIKPIANFVENSDLDSEDDDNHMHQGNCHEKLSSTSRGKRSHPKFASRSLPVTPRVNGNCSNAQNLVNGGISSSFTSGSIGSSTPLLVAPHMMNHFPLHGSLNSVGSLSPVASQYVTCSSGIMSETPEKVLPGSIDYSSLPLPKEESFRIPNKRHISRHMSEPCIHEIPNSHLSGIGKCSSCPNKKTSRHKKKDPILCGIDSESSSGLENQLRNSFGGIDYKSDNLETVELQWKFIKTLLEELNKCRSQNSRMAIELHQSQMEIQMLKGALDTYVDAGIQPGVLTEMVSQIHGAQKIRDEAMMSRIKLANEERDSAITQTQTLLEKLGYSPKSAGEYLKFNVSGYNDQTSSLSSKNEINLVAIEEELKALRLSLNNQEQEKSSHNDSRSIKSVKEPDVETQEVLEELKTKLKESEISKLKLQEKCSSLEHIFDHLHRKINGLNAVDGLGISSTSLAFLDMSLSSKAKHEEDTNASPRLTTYDENFPDSRCKKHNLSERNRKNLDGDTENEGDSLSSSADSGETSSAASWKHACSLDNHCHHNSIHHTHSSEPSSYSSSQPSSSIQTSHSHDGINNNCNVNSVSKNGSLSIDNKSPSSSLSRSEFKPRNLGAVTLMGPITEL